MSGCEEELNEVFGAGLLVKGKKLFCDNSNIFLFSSESDSDDDEEASLGSMIKQTWMKRKQILEHDFAVTSWARSTLLEIRDDVRVNLDGDKRMAIERVTAKLHVDPNPNPKVANNENDMIIHIFWKKLDIFTIKLESMNCAQAFFFSQMS